MNYIIIIYLLEESWKGIHYSDVWFLGAKHYIPYRLVLLRQIKNEMVRRDAKLMVRYFKFFRM